MTQLPGKARIIIRTTLFIVLDVISIYACIAAYIEKDDMKLFLRLVMLPIIIIYTTTELFKMWKETEVPENN
jgi:uncharacterized membrane protein